MKAFRIPEPQIFIAEFQAGNPKYFTVSHHVLIGQLKYEIQATLGNFYKLPRLEKAEKVNNYQKCIELVQADYKEKTGKELKID